MPLTQAFPRAIPLSLSAVLAAVLLLEPVSAQVFYGSLLGTVEDKTGGVVPGAAVTITNTATGQSRATTTNPAGAYSFADLLPGSYTVSVAAAGFRSSLTTNVEITINTVRRVDVRLQLGELKESVTVAADATVIQADKADVHVELATQELTQLPVSGYRNYQALFNLVPGATPAAYRNAVNASPARALVANINGTTESNNNTRLDGASNMRASLSHQTLYVPPAESIETVNVVTNSFDADQGLAGGAAISINTKSGTNDLHGVMFEHHSNSKLRARNFFDSSQQRPRNNINIYGGTLGGPIRRNQLFFFTSWEGLRERSSFSRLTTVPDANQRTGNFSGLGVSLFDPLTGKSDGSDRVVFPIATVPMARQSVITRKLQDLIPPTNRPGAVSNYFASAPVSFDRDNFDVKINWNPSQRSMLWGKYSAMNALVTAQFSLGKAGGQGMIDGGGAGTGDILAQVATIGGVHTFSPTFLVDGNFGFSRDPVTLIGPDSGTNFGLTMLGIPGTNGPQLYQSGMPMFSVSGYETLGNPDVYLPKIVRNSNWTYTTSFGWTRGSHDMRFGLDLIHYRVNEWHGLAGSTNGPRGQFGFTGGITSLKGGTAPNQFNAWGAFLLGLPQNVGSSILEWATLREWLEGYYFRDRWQVTRNLTVTLGMRWEYYPLVTRAHRGIERYDPEVNKVFVGGAGSVPKDAGISVSKRLFAPRLGIGYRLGQKGVVRAGYGISIDPSPMSAVNTMLFPYPVIVNHDFAGANSFQAVWPIERGIPEIKAPDLTSGVIAIPPTATTVTLKQGLFKRGYIQSFNFILERQLPWGLVGSAGYVGTRTIHQATRLNINAAPPGGGASGRPLAARFGRTVDTRVYDNFQTGTYDSLQARLDRRFTNGLLIKASYTWSKTINWTDGSGGTLFFNDASALVRNRALAGYDRPHTFRLAWVGELPFGAGKRWANTRGVTRFLLGGWQVNGIFSSYCGTPFTLTSSNASLNAPGNSQTADQVKPKVKKLGGIGADTPFFDPLAFAPVTEVRFGTAGRNILRGPGVVNVDAGLFRNFRLSERWKLQFRAEAYNFTNTPHFQNPSANVSNMRLNSDGTIRSLGNFMSITEAASGSSAAEGGERQFRFALRISF